MPFTYDATVSATLIPGSTVQPFVKVIADPNTVANSALFLPPAAGNTQAKPTYVGAASAGHDMIWQLQPGTNPKSSPLDIFINMVQSVGAAGAPQLQTIVQIWQAPTANSAPQQIDNKTAIFNVNLSAGAISAVKWVLVNFV